LNIIGITREVNRLANTARNGKLSPSDTTDGTFTFTNVGTFGSLMGTPIINQPQVAIMATGAIKKKPVVIETEKGDSIAIRHIMFVSLSYDHRIIDGAMGSSFLAEYTKAIESFDPERSY
jgi:2-oxoglutarate dehydrogenase E2 component (dihydrolipoamide succinyltransferase)